LFQGVTKEKLESATLAIELRYQAMRNWRGRCQDGSKM
jgi:hypothetical protein